MADWTPSWQAAHAYSVLAVVIPSTFAGYTWRCTTAGTSGGVEPAWPADPSLSATVTDGGVTWSVGTGFRQAIQSTLGTAVTGLIAQFASANPTIIRSIATVKPLSFTTTALPCFFLGNMNERVTTMNGVRQRLVEGFNGYLVDVLSDPRQSSDRFNFAVDALTDLFTANYHVISGRSLFQHTATLDTEFAEGGAIFPAVEFQFALTNVMEGRI